MSDAMAAGHGITRSWHLWFWIVLFLCCVVSRLLTTVYYIEDIDSLNFAYAIREYDISKMRPHFPGYPVFCFIAKVFAAITGSFSIAFSIVGGISTFVIITLLLWISRIAKLIISEWLIVLLLFFNPMIWLMSNRYMPDLMGVAVSLGAMLCYFRSTTADSESVWKRSFTGNRSVICFWLLTGLLGGVRLSYLPILFIPALDLFFSKERKGLQVAVFITGVAVWFVPVLLDTGFYELIQAAKAQTTGHFTSWGGTVSNEPEHGERTWSFIRNIVADGMGGWWMQGSWLRIVISVLMIAALIPGAIKLRKVIYNRSMLILLLSLLLYAVWIFFFQNIIHKPRHVMILVPFMVLSVSYGLTRIANINRIAGTLISVAFILFTGIISINLAIDHTRPTAIARVSQYLRNKPLEGKRLIISIPLVNKYLESTGVKGDYYDLTPEKSATIDPTKYDDIISVGNFELWENMVREEKTFYHNPDVNRMWPEIELRSYEIAAENQ